MWRTSEGDRVLRGAEWRLFCYGLDLLYSETEERLERNAEFDSGVEAFDVLDSQQRLLQLALVGAALRDKSIPTPELTAVNEATVAAVFATVASSMEVELDCPKDDPEPYRVRKLILAACKGQEEETGRLPKRSCMDAEEWHMLIEVLTDRILWDRDFEMGAEFLDDEPTEARGRMRLAGIGRDYYVALAPEPTKRQLKEARATLRRLTHE